MNHLLKRYLSPFLIILSLPLILAGCGGSGGSIGDVSDDASTRASGAGGGAGGTGGAGSGMVAARSFDGSLVSTATREDGSPVTVNFTVFEPARAAGQTFPLIVHSHGIGGSRVGIVEADGYSSTPRNIDDTESVFNRIDEQVRLLWDAGYGVISFDERGFGRGDDGDDGNSGQMEIMDPIYEIQDAIAVLDWADNNLDLTRDGSGNPLVGTIGGSYGGGYQLLLTALDDRIDAITPNSTWYNLLQSLVPNDVIKKGFSTGLCLVMTNDNTELGRRVTNACQQAGDAGAPSARYREDIPENLPAAGNRDELLSSFVLNSMVEYERRHLDSGDSFTMRPVNALFIQGTRDILFNFNQARENYRFFSTLPGADVRFMTMENGHGIASRANPGSQGPLGPSACGPLDSLAATRAWFDLHLRGDTSAEADLPMEACLSLDDTRGASMSELPVANASDARFNGFTVTIPNTSLNGMAQNNIFAVDGGIFIPLANSISTPGLVLAGIPVADITVSDGPTGGANNGSTAFIGVAIRRGGSIFLVDDQVQPIRSSDPRATAPTEPLQLVGIGEALEMGDEVGVILYGMYDVYETGTGSAAVNFGATNSTIVEGTVRLPILGATIINR